MSKVIDTTFKLRSGDDFIELYKLLKVLNFVESGSMAKLVISEGLVKVSQKIEYRKRKKISCGEIVEFDKKTILVISNKND
ncbi:MAG: RNA-binding S4 domain-containing protein [Pontiellaceae bacterium]